MLEWENKQIKTQKGFTIVELLIVVIVIAILAAITIVAYNGISQRSRISALQSELSQTAKALEAKKIADGIETYPTLLSDINVTSSKLTYHYNSRSNTFCVDGKDGTIEYSVRSAVTTPTDGSCIHNGMAVWMPLNGDTTDNSGNGHTATLTGSPAPTTGVYGVANTGYRFTGSNQYMTISNADTIPSQTNNYSVSIWGKGVSSAGGDFGYYVLRGTTTSIGSSVYWLGTNTGGTQYLGAASVGRYLTGITTISANASTWHNLILVYADGYQTLYVDGVQRIDQTQSTASNTTTGTVLTIGGSASGFRTINGSLDDFRVYNRALALSEVSALYTAGAE
ncbi:MAG: LamG-like jellyroll fold domain-containing protein [Candidatus Saccharimonadaceae bacterium]